jgi:hypothetical protein
MEYDEEIPPTDIDWESRTLCVDESCIGVIGPDGKCKECGKPFSGDQEEDDQATHDGDKSSYEIDPVEDEDDESSYEEDHAQDEEDESPSDIDWENRTLCIDESCIGVIGPDGKCKECGKPFKDL